VEKPVRPTAEYLAEVAWALLLFNAMAAGAGVLVGVHLESIRLGLAVFMGGSITVTLLLALLVAATVAWDAIARALARRTARRSAEVRPPAALLPAALLLTAALVAASCGGEPRAGQREDTSGGGPPAAGQSGMPEGSMAFNISSTAFAPNGSMPAEHTCDGSDTSPPLAWSDVPEGTRSLAVIVDDPDAPDPRAPKRTWVHWVVYDIPPAATGLAADASPGKLPDGAREGLNDWGRPGYGGPCPPIGRHRYFHKLFALDTLLPDLRRPTRAELEQAMAGHVLARAELVGTYLRSK